MYQCPRCNSRTVSLKIYHGVITGLRCGSCRLDKSLDWFNLRYEVERIEDELRASTMS